MTQEKQPLHFKKIRSGSVLIGIILGILAAFAFQQIPFSKNVSAALTLPGTGTTICGLSQMPANSTVNGLSITEMEFNNLTSTYQAGNPADGVGTTWGGVIGKNQLIAVINSLGSNSTEVNFKFITNPSNGKTSIIFKGGSQNPVTGGASTGNLYMRTGTASEAFCPTRCQ